MGPHKTKSFSTAKNTINPVKRMGAEHWLAVYPTEGLYLEYTMN